MIWGYHYLSDTVDGRNPKQPPGMVKNPINNGIVIILGGAGFCPSTVSSDMGEKNRSTFQATSENNLQKVPQKEGNRPQSHGGMVQMNFRISIPWSYVQSLNFPGCSVDSSCQRWQERFLLNSGPFSVGSKLLVPFGVTSAEVAIICPDVYVKFLPCW